MRELGWVEGKLPRLVSVQVEGCAPIVKAFKEKKTQSEFWEHSKTVAFGLNVPKALGDFLVLDAIYASEGCAVTVGEAAILASQLELGQKEGLFVCPEGATLYAAVKDLRENGWIRAEESVVLLNTGAGIKYPNTVSIAPPYLELDSEL
jgi:threonine synthase